MKPLFAPKHLSSSFPYSRIAPSLRLRALLVETNPPLRILDCFSAVVRGWSFSFCPTTYLLCLSSIFGDFTVFGRYVCESLSLSFCGKAAPVDSPWCYFEAFNSVERLRPKYGCQEVEWKCERLCSSALCVSLTIGNGRRMGLTRGRNKTLEYTGIFAQHHLLCVSVHKILWYLQLLCNTCHTQGFKPAVFGFLFQSILYDG